MMGFTPTGILARICPKPMASTGLLGSQFGLVGSAATEHRGMLMMLTEPAVVPFPAFATTSSLRVGARSAQLGAVPVPRAMGFVLPAGGVSSALV